MSIFVDATRKEMPACLRKHVILTVVAQKPGNSQFSVLYNNNRRIILIMLNKGELQQMCDSGLMIKKRPVLLPEVLHLRTGYGL